jgi:Tfp pilus assembly protein PilO
MRKLNRRETIILVITLGLIVFFTAYQFVFKPVHKGSTDINDQLRLDRGELVKVNQLLGQKDLIEARYKNLVAIIGAQDSEEAQMPAIISKIETAAREGNVHIANIQPQKSVTQKEVKFLTVELEIDGQWLDIVHFLYLLQEKPNLYFINELNLEKYSGAVSSLRGRIVISRMCLLNP